MLDQDLSFPLFFRRCGWNFREGRIRRWQSIRLRIRDWCQFRIADSRLRVRATTNNNFKKMTLCTDATTYVIVSENLRATFSTALFFEDDNADASIAPSLADVTVVAAPRVSLLVPTPANRMSSSFATCLKSTLESILPIGIWLRMVIADHRLC